MSLEFDVNKLKPIGPNQIHYAPNSVIKDTNPKDAVGVTKAPLSVLPMQVVYEAALGMYEGALKYGAFNYRVAGVRASVYYDAIERVIFKTSYLADLTEDIIFEAYKEVVQADHKR